MDSGPGYVTQLQLVLSGHLDIWLRLLISDYVGTVGVKELANTEE